MRHGNSAGISARAAGRRSGTRVALLACATATWVTFAGLACTSYCAASELAVTVVGRDGHGIGEVVVAVMPTAGAAPPPARTAVMDQKDRAFVPQVLVVGVGSQVEFPNNDSVSHQVYSFSAAKRFQLPLYKGQVHPPVTFDTPGLVVLGCNIHDSMVGYIYVTAAPWFGSTDGNGELRLADLPKGDYQITLYSPYIADAPAALTRSVHLDPGATAVEHFQLTAALRARPEPKPRRRDWDY